MVEMSYERNKLKKFNMPDREDMEKSLLKFLFNNNGSIKEFGSKEAIVTDFSLSSFILFSQIPIFKKFPNPCTRFSTN